VAVGIVQPGGAVDADTDPNAVPLEQLAPFIVDQRGIGLDRMRDLAGGAEHLAHHRDRLVVERRRHRQRFTGMPNNRELGADQSVVAQPLGRAAHGRDAHARRGVALGQIAVVAVDVAERRGLQDQKPRADRG